MYDNNTKQIDWKNIIKRLGIFLGIVIIIFGFVTLVTKIFSKPKDTKTPSDNEQTLVAQIETMQQASLKYFTKDNLPLAVNEPKSVKLKYLINKDITEGIKDKKGNSCDINRSYSEVTKLEDSYALKVSMTCGEITEYQIYYIGCYESCPEGSICIKDENITGGTCENSNTSGDSNNASENTDYNSTSNSNINTENNSSDNSAASNNDNSSEEDKKNDNDGSNDSSNNVDNSSSSTTSQENSNNSSGTTDKDKDTSSKDKNTSSKDKNTSSKDKNTSSKDKDTSSKDKNTSSKDKNTSSKDKNTSSKDKNTASKDKNTSTSDSSKPSTETKEVLYEYTRSKDKYYCTEGKLVNGNKCEITSTTIDDTGKVVAGTSNKCSDGFNYNSDKKTCTKTIAATIGYTCKKDSKGNEYKYKNGTCTRVVSTISSKEETKEFNNTKELKDAGYIYKGYNSKSKKYIGEKKTNSCKDGEQEKDGKCIVSNKKLVNKKYTCKSGSLDGKNCIITDNSKLLAEVEKKPECTDGYSYDESAKSCIIKKDATPKDVYTCNKDSKGNEYKYKNGTCTRVVSTISNKEDTASFNTTKELSNAGYTYKGYDTKTKKYIGIKSGTSCKKGEKKSGNNCIVEDKSLVKKTIKYECTEGKVKGKKCVITDNNKLKNTNTSTPTCADKTYTYNTESKKCTKEVKKKTKVDALVETVRETVWSTEETLDGWERTGNEK